MFAGDWGLEVRGHGGGSHVPVDLCDSVRGGHLGFIPSAGLPESYHSERAAHLRNASHMMSNEDNGLALLKQICWHSVRMFIVVSRFKPLVDSKSCRVCLKPCYCIERAKKKTHIICTRPHHRGASLRQEKAFFCHSLRTCVHWGLSPLLFQQRRLLKRTERTFPCTDVYPKCKIVRWGTSVCCQMLFDDVLVFNLLVYYHLIWLWCVINVWIIKINGCPLSGWWNVWHHRSHKIVRELQWWFFRTKTSAE